MVNNLLINRIVSFLFVGFLLVPSVSLLFSEQDDISLTEKRKLAELPKINSSYRSVIEYPKNFGVFFEDHFGFRNQIIRLHNCICCKIFRSSPSRFVIAGEGSWYFLNMDGSLFDYLGHIHFEEITLHKMKNLLMDRKEWLNSIGGEYLFLPIPNKEMVYEEFLPDILQQNRGKSKYDQIISFLGKSNDFPNYIDVKKLMLEHKNEQQMYFKTDSHWNSIGAFVLYCEIIRRLQQWFPDMICLQKTAVQEWVPGGSGDLADLMNVAGKLTELVPKLPVILRCNPFEESIMEEIREISEYRDIAEYRLPVKTGCDTAKYKAIIFHDSFGDALKPYLTQHFKEVIYIHYMNFNAAKKIIEMERPDVVIDLRVARNIEKALRRDPELEQLVVRDKFNEMREVLFDLNFAADQKGVRDSSAISRQKGDTGFISTHGSSVSFSPGFEGKQVLPEKMAVRLDIDSEKAMNLLCCYKSGTVKGRKGKQCQIRKLVAGSNEIFLRVLTPDKNGVFFLFPPKKRVKGKYHIRRVVAKREV